MNLLTRTALACANAAFRIKDYGRALELYDEALKYAKGEMRAQININRAAALRKLGAVVVERDSPLDEDLSAEQEVKPNTIERYARLTQTREQSSRGFDLNYYLSKYPDIRKVSIDAYEHYISHGKEEGRQGAFNFDSIVSAGCKKYDPAIDTLMLVCHEASRTGAPILGLNIAQALSAKFNLVVWLGKAGPLLEDFRKCAFLLIDHDPGHTDIVWTIREIREKYKLTCGILNSVTTSKFSSALFELKVPTLALVHEYADYMSAAVLQVLATANRVVFPARGVKQSADDYIFKMWDSHPKQSVFRNQGVCILPKGEKEVSYSKENILRRLGIGESETKPAIVMGCGWVQIRKGVEYFIHVAQLCKKMTTLPMRFIWIGGGFNPSDDLQYGVWLQSQVKNSGLEDSFAFFDETDDLSPFFHLADVFFLSSRLDPFPNVAIDSVKANVPVVAFDRATGFTDFIESHPTIGVVVPYLDVYAAAESIIDLASRGRPPRTEHEQRSIDESLHFDRYVEFLLEQCRVAIRQQGELEAEVALLEKTKLMTPRFYASAIPNYTNTRTGSEEYTTLLELSDEYVYAARWMRGFHSAKSRVGFNDVKAELQLNKEGFAKLRVTPLARWIETGKPFSTHPTHSIRRKDEKYPMSTNVGLRVAVHIHAYNVEGLSSLLSRLSLILPHVDVFITTTSEVKLAAVNDICQQVSQSLNVRFIPSCLITPNIGRDVGSFFMTLKESLLAYDLVGHFHIKGTKQLSESIVQQWQDFLFDTLLGPNGEAALEIFDLFEKESDLGLVFQEDPCVPSWGKNYENVLNLAKELGIADKVPEAPEYPTGNMFWVRPSALGMLLKKDWRWSDFPSEPIPYDGTLLHALERITPIACEAASYYWMTITNPPYMRYS